MASTPAGNDFKLTFDDEFNTLSLDNNSSGTWQPSIWWSPNGSTDDTISSWSVNPMWGPTSGSDANPFSVDNGVLSIAIKPTPGSVSGSVQNKPFLAGQLTTHRTFAQTYGYFEMRAKLTGGAGTESAFWLLPADGSWPPELDAVEVLGNSPSTLVMTSHSNTDGTTPHWSDIPNASADFHTYGVDWEPDKITWYFDGKQMSQQNTPSDLNKPMYLLLSTMTGTSSSWIGAPNASSPSSMQVDYVRTYSRDPNAAAATPQSGYPSGDGSSGGSSPPASTPATPAPATDTLVVSLSEDAWQGDAQCVITVDGKTVGGTVTVTASHAKGASQLVALSGQWGPGAHDIGVQFINDAWGGTTATDRNLYVNGVALDGQASTAAPATLYGNSTAHLQTGASPLVLQLSEDAYGGDAQFTVAVDGKVLGGAQTVTASHGAGAVQNFAFAQALSAGAHDIAVSFLNDAWGGTAATDRNLYVHAVDANGAAMPGTAAVLMTTSTQHFSIIAPSA